MSTDDRAPDPPERGPVESNGVGTVTDAELIRYLDGELVGEARSSLESRLAVQPALAARLETLRRRTVRLSELLGVLDPQLDRVARSAATIRPRVTAVTRRPYRLGIPPALRAAAAIAILLGVTVAVPPARAWVVERVRDVAAALGIAGDAVTQAPPPVDAPAAAPPDGAAIAVSFPVVVDTFDVHAPAAAGTLVVRRGPGEAGRIVISGAPGAEALVLPGGVQLDGAGDAAAVYELTLPAGVSAIRLSSGDGATVHPLPAAGGGLRIRLR